MGFAPLPYLTPRQPHGAARGPGPAAYGGVSELRGRLLGADRSPQGSTRPVRCQKPHVEADRAPSASPGGGLSCPSAGLKPAGRGKFCPGGVFFSPHPTLTRYRQTERRRYPATEAASCRQLLPGTLWPFDAAGANPTCRFSEAGGRSGADPVSFGKRCRHSGKGKTQHPASLPWEGRSSPAGERFSFVFSRRSPLAAVLPTFLSGADVIFP